MLQGNKNQKVIKGLIPLFFLLILSFSVLGNYGQTGGTDSNFQRETGFFNSELDFTLALNGNNRLVTSGKHQPLIADLNNDGINEIIVIDGGNLRLYNNITLDIVDTYSIANEELSNMLAFDIDGDNLTELIFVETASQKLQIIEYNTSDIYNQTTIDFTIGSASHVANADIMIACRGIEDCFTVWSDKATGGGGVGRMYARFMNSTNLSVNITEISVGSWANSKFCFPYIKSISIADYDNDGIEEYIFSSYENDASAQLRYYIHYIDVTDRIVSNDKTAISETESSFAAGLTCASTDNRALSPVIVHDTDSSPSNGLETIVAYNKDSDEFVMRRYKASGSVERFPGIADADGKLVSNVFLANVFDGSDNNDFCAVGYRDTDERMDVLCGSDLDAVGLFDNIQFKYSVTSFFNISTQDFYNYMSHAAQHSTITADNGNNPHEVINSYGVFFLDFDSCSIIDGNCDIELIFENPIIDSVVLPVDYEENSREDLIVISDTNVWYLDDGFINQPGVIQEYTINPCIDSTWKVNSTSQLEIRITPFDQESDLVSARAIVYLGDSNEQDSGWSINVSSGSTISLTSFVINKTIGTGVLRLMGRDIENPSIVDTIDLTFSASTNGVEFGDCFTASGDLLTEPETNISGVPDEIYTNTDNRLSAAIVNLSNTAGVPVLIMALIVMLVMNILVIAALWQIPLFGLGVNILVDIFIILILVLMGFIVESLFISLFALVIIAGGILMAFLWNKFQSP